MSQPLELSVRALVAAIFCLCCHLAAGAPATMETPPLPTGYHVPDEPAFPVPNPYETAITACSSCRAGSDRLYLFELDKVIHSVNVDSYASQWSDSLLTIFHGQPRIWQPERFIAFYPNGINESEKDAAIILNNELIKFKKRDGVDGDVTLVATSFPTTTLKRIGDHLVFQHHENRRYHLESLDGGTDWHLTRIEWLDHPGFETRLEYDGHKISRLVYPNGQAAKFEYRDDSVYRIDLPNSHLIELEWDETIRLASLAIYDTGVDLSTGEIPRGRSVWKRENGVAKSVWVPSDKAPGGLVAQYRYMNDAKGRVVRFVNACGVEYAIDYLMQKNEHGEYLDSIVRRVDSGTFDFMRHHKHEGKWLVTRGFGAPGESIEDATVVSVHGYQVMGGRWMATSIEKPISSSKTVYAYNRDNRLSQIVRNGKETRYTYEDRNTQIDFPSGRRVIHSRDESGALAAMQEGDQAPVQYTRDELGNVTEQRQVGRPTITYSYDEHGFPSLATKEGMAWRYVYDELGRMITLFQPNGLKWDFKYDDFDRLKSYHVNDATPDMGVENAWSRTFVYNWRGNLVKIKTDKSESTAIYSCGLLQKVTTPDSVSEYSYDANGKLVHKRVVGKREERYRYDEFHRLVAHGFDAGDGWVVTRYEYTPDGIRRMSAQPTP